MNDTGQTVGVVKTAATEADATKSGVAPRDASLSVASAVPARMTSVAKQRINPIAYAKTLLGGSAEDERTFVAAMHRRFGAQTHVVPVGRARSGIYLMTKFAVRNGRRKVLLSPYTIPDVVTMVVLAGGEPEFFDFERDSTACDVGGLAEQIDATTACVMITHHHVNEPRLQEIGALCKARGAYLFDDCAIVFGGTIDGKPIGTLTDGSVFSFSSFKLLNFFWGGMVTTQDAELAEFLRRTVAEWPRLAARDYLKQAKSCLQYDLASRPGIFDAVVFPMFQKRTRASGAPASLENTRIETEDLNPTITSRPSLSAFAEWNRKLPSVEAWLQHRRSIARIYQRKLGAYMLSGEIAEQRREGSCFVNFPVVVPAEHSDAICREMMLAGFDIGRNLYPNVHKHPKYKSLPGKSTNVDRMPRTLLYLPTHFGVTPEYASAISAHLLKVLSAGGIAQSTVCV